MAFLPCPYLETDVELSDDRERHILSHHPDFVRKLKEGEVEWRKS